MIRKFHVLTYHIPEKARMRKTVGMEAEQCSESIHPIVNELQRKYNTVQNSKKRLELIAKSQILKATEA